MTVRDALGADRVGEELVLTPMRRRHLRGVMHIEHRVYPRPWSVALFLGELNLKAGREYAVARAGTTVVGYGGVMLVGPDAHVTTLAVEPDRHRRGIGTRLLALLCRRAVALGAEQITLEVRVSNDAARELYQRFGFAPGGIRKNYYAETREDALIMWAYDVATDGYRSRLGRLEAASGVRARIEGFDGAELGEGR